MTYKYLVERQNYADYAPGAVLYSLPGTPTFPLRLASEMFQRGVAQLPFPGPYTLYDPCCGSGYLLTTLAYLHWDKIGAIIASDIDAHALSLAEANLSLLTVDGLERRIAQIERLWCEYGKTSHHDALQSAARLKAQLLDHLRGHTISTRVLVADVTDAQALFDGLAGPGVQRQTIDMVLTDLPYGQHSNWQTSRADPVWCMLDALRRVISPHTVLAIASDKAQQIVHAAYQRLERFKIGKRQITIVRLAATGLREKRVNL